MGFLPSDKIGVNTIKIADSISTGTYSDKLQSLVSAFNNLTDSEKTNSYIEFVGFKFRLSSIRSGITAFSAVSLNGRNIRILVITLEGKYYVDEFETSIAPTPSGVSGTVKCSEFSSTSDSNIFTLYVSC